MEWTALTRERLEEMISSGLETMDDAVQDAWRGMRIEPERWQCSPWGDQGGGFWVVAEKDGCVVWYNDIEDGFNVSVFDERGTIAEYACNQTTFEEFLTTYWDLRSMDGSLWRVHFMAKVEARFEQSRFSTIEIVDTHPVLGQYFEPWAQLFFTGIPTDPEALRRLLADRVAVATAGWRTLEEYITEGSTSERATASSCAPRSRCGCLHVDFAEEHRAFYVGSCGFRPTPAGLRPLERA